MNDKNKKEFKDLREFAPDIQELYGQGISFCLSCKEYDLDREKVYNFIDLLFCEIEEKGVEQCIKESMILAREGLERLGKEMEKEIERLKQGN